MTDPFTAMAIGAYMISAPAAGNAKRYRDTAASIGWSAKALSATGTTSITDFLEPVEAPSVFLDPIPSLAWVELSHAILGNSRSMEAWERQSLDAFTWAELEA